MKYCYRCKQLKSLIEFNKNKSKKDGYSCECKDCIKEIGCEIRLKRKEKNIIKISEYKKCPSCGIKKHKNDYHLTLSNVDGLSTYCKTCRSDLRRKIPDKKKCSQCGKDFLETRSDKVFCSKKCATLSFWNKLTIEEKISKIKTYYTKNYEKNKQKINLLNREYYRKKSADSNYKNKKNIKTREQYWNNIKENRNRNNEKQKKYSLELTDSYVIRNLKRKLKRWNLLLSDEEIISNKVLIELEKDVIINQRLSIKEKK